VPPTRSASAPPGTLVSAKPAREHEDSSAASCLAESISCELIGTMATEKMVRCSVCKHMDAQVQSKTNLAAGLVFPCSMSYARFCNH